MHMGYVFDFLVVNVILGSFGADVSKWPTTQKRLATERNGGKIWDLGVVVTRIFGTFTLLVFKIMLGPFSALV